MNRLLLCLFLFGIAVTGRAADGVAEDYDPKLAMRDQMIVILGSFRDFREAETQARAISRASGVPFSLDGKIFDKKRGLILPDDDPDTLYAGTYFLRRYNRIVPTGNGGETDYISIERSEAYPGLRGGYYIIVGGLYDTRREAAASLARYKLPAADAYAKKTQVYMGCMH